MTGLRYFYERAKVNERRPKNVEAYRLASRTALTGLILNVVLAGLKVAAGRAAGSMALVSDAVNSVGDVATSVVVLWGLSVAQTPPDRRHPYGHSRAESIATLVITVMIGLSAVGLAYEALSGGGSDKALPPAWTLWVAAANMVAQVGLAEYKRRAGHRSGSSALKANAWDHRSDALSSLAALVGLAAIRWGGSDFAWADLAAALVVVGLIFWSAARLFHMAAGEIMDQQADESLVTGIRDAARQIGEVHAVEKLLVRKSGLEYFADIHIEVDPNMTVAEGHRIGHLVKDRVLEAFPEVRDVLVHLEPHLETKHSGQKNEGTEK